MILHTMSGRKQVTQIDHEVDYTLDTTITDGNGYGLLYIDKDATTGTVTVQLAGDSENTVLDVTKIDVNNMNFLVSKVVSVSTITQSQVHVYQ